MRSFHEFVENRNESLLNEYIKYCLDNNLEIDEGLLDTFKKYGKAALVAAAPFVAGGMMAPKAGATEFTTKDMGTNTMNVISKDPSQYKFKHGDWQKRQADGGESKFEMWKLKDKMDNLQKRYPHFTITWDDQTDKFKATQKGTKGDLIYIFSPENLNKPISVTQTER